MGKKFLISSILLLGSVSQVTPDTPESYLKKRWYTIEMVVFEKVPVPTTPELVINVVEKRVLPADTIAMQFSDEELARITEYSNIVDFDAVVDEWFFDNPWHVAPIKNEPSPTDQDIDVDAKYRDGCWMHVVDLEEETSSGFEFHEDWSARIANLFQEDQTRDPRLPEWLPDVWQTFDHNVIASAQALGLCREDIAILFDEEYLDFMRLEKNKDSISASIEEQDEKITPNLVQEAFAKYETELNRNALTPQSSRLNLQHTANRLKDNGYRIIDHFAWIQDGLARGSESNVLAQFGQHSENGFREVEGTIAFSVARFLHLKLDLWRLVVAPKNYDPKKTEFESPVFFYEIQESRRMALGEVHYFDHPKFGVLVQIRRLPIPDNLNELVEQLNGSS